MIHANCDGCGDEIEEKAAVLFGPPIAGPELLVDLAPKRHLCIPCYGMVIGVLEKRARRRTEELTRRP